MEQPYQVIPEQPTYERQKSASKAIRALVFGILAVALHNVIGLVFGILAIVQGNGSLALSQQYDLAPETRAKVGRILGIVGIVASVIGMIWGAVKFTGFIAALIASIQSGSLGSISDYFWDLGHSINGTVF